MTASKFANRLNGYIDAEPENGVRNLNAAKTEFDGYTVAVLGSDPQFNVIFEQAEQLVFSMTVNIDVYKNFADNPEAIETLGDLINEKMNS